MDLVCFTGDVANAGQADEYTQAGVFLRGLLTHLKLPLERLFIVPGNHDIDRDVGKTAWEALRRAYDRVHADTLSSWMMGGKPPLSLEDGQREALLSRQAAYRPARGGGQDDGGAEPNLTAVRRRLPLRERPLAECVPPH